MKYLNKYKLFCEANEADTVQDNLLSDIDSKEIDDFNIKTDDIKKKIELKKQELEKQLETLEKFDVMNTIDKEMKRRNIYQGDKKDS